MAGPLRTETGMGRSTVTRGWGVIWAAGNLAALLRVRGAECWASKRGCPYRLRRLVPLLQRTALRGTRPWEAVSRLAVLGQADNVHCVLLIWFATVVCAVAFSVATSGEDCVGILWSMPI